MKKLVGCGLLAFIAVMAPLGYSLNDIDAVDIKVEEAAGHGQDSGRPFSFYYPYSYQYYYPHLQIGAASCYWMYTNGTYVYFCS